MNNRKNLENKFDLAMLSIYDRAKCECKYNATRFLQMLTEHGGVQTAKILINAPHISDGFSELWKLGRLDLSVEAIILEPEWESIFSKEERNIAKKRLVELGYKLKG